MINRVKSWLLAIFFCTVIASDYVLLGMEQESAKKTDSLLQAAAYNEIQTLEALIKQEMSLECRNFEDFTPLMLAARNGHGQCITFLLKNGADVHAYDSPHRNTALIEALFAYAPDSVEALLSFDYKKKKNKCMTKLLQTKNRKGATAVSIALHSYRFYTSMAPPQISTFPLNIDACILYNINHKNDNKNQKNLERLEIIRNELTVCPQKKEQQEMSEVEEFNDIINKFRSILKILKRYRHYWSEEDQTSDDNYQITKSLL